MYGGKQVTSWMIIEAGGGRSYLLIEFEEAMRVQKLDAYALRRYEFTLANTHSYFTRWSILLSILIVLSAVVANLPVLSHLWMSRQALPTQNSRSFSYPEPLTSTLFCFRSNLKNATSAPKARIMRSPSLTVLDLPLLDQEAVKAIKPHIAEKINHSFGCFDLGGFAFTEEDKEFYMEVEASNVTLFIESTTSQAIISRNQTRLIEVKQGKQRFIRILHAQDADTLVLNAPPTITNTIFADPSYSSAFQAPISFPFRSPYAKFKISLFIPYSLMANSYFNFNLHTVKIAREDVGFIIGTVLSWISSVSMACAIFMVPYMDRKLKLTLAESVFLLRQEMKSPNVFKFAIAEWKRGIFQKEDLYVSLCERLERMKDAGTMLRGMRIVKRLYHDLPMKAENIACEESFDPRRQEPVQLFSDKEESYNTAILFEEDHKKQDKTSEFRRQFLKSLDIGSDPVSILYPGAGHGSKLNVFLQVIFCAGFIAFLLFFNLAKLSSSVTIVDQLPSGDITYRPQANAIIFASEEDALILASLHDGQFNTLSYLTINSGSNCLANLTDSQIKQVSNYGQYYYCLGEEITLVSSTKAKESVSLYIDNTNFQSNMLGVFHFSRPQDSSSASSHYRPINPLLQISPDYDPASNPYYEESQLLLTKIVSANGDESMRAQFAPFAELSNALVGGKTGINIVLKHAVTVITETEVTLFDILQNVWGLAVICFTVILFKIAKYINVFRKQQKMNPQRTKFRENICILLARLNELAIGRHKRQLNHFRYYLKQPCLPRI